MDLEMVLNELSLEPSATTVQQARQRMVDFLDTVRAAGKLGVQKVIRTAEDIHYLPLAPDYPFARWRNDNEVDKEMRRYFSTLLTKAPYLKDIGDNTIEDVHGRSQFSYQNNEAKGLGIAYLLEALALSFRSNEDWEQHELALTLIELNDEGELQEEQVILVNHASSAVHVQQHTNWIKTRILSHRQLDIHDGNDLWARRDTLFPSLQFCAVVQKQLQNVLHGEPLLPQIINKLVAFNKFCEAWDNGPFNHHDIPAYITPESEATLKRYKDEHTFLCPDGTWQLFSWHARLTPGAWRTYFYMDEEKKSITIGYIGHKLPNVLYPT